MEAGGGTGAGLVRARGAFEAFALASACLIVARCTAAAEADVDLAFAQTEGARRAEIAGGQALGGAVFT